MITGSLTSASAVVVLVLLVGTVLFRRVSREYECLLKLRRGMSGDELKQYLVRLLFNLDREFEVRAEVRSWGNEVRVTHIHFPSQPLLTIEIDMVLPQERQVTLEIHSTPGVLERFDGTADGVQTAAARVKEYTESLLSPTAA